MGKRKEELARKFIHKMSPNTDRLKSFLTIKKMDALVLLKRLWENVKMKINEIKK